MNRLAAALLLIGTSGATMENHFPDAAALDRLAAQFAPVDLAVDISALPDNERRALAKILEASSYMDALYLDQVWAGNATMLMDLSRDATPLGRARLRYFLVHMGPWDRQEHDRAFLPGAPAKPEGGTFYPVDATRAEIEAWIAGLAPAEREKATGFFTAIRRMPDGKFGIVPYSVIHGPELGLASAALRDAAALTTQPTLKAFLEARAAAFRSNEYRDSDVAWMKLDASIEPTIGPYEVYEDAWFNYKATFESFVALRDDAETKKLERFSEHLQELENALPIDPAMRNPKIGALAPIRVVNVIATGGDANHGVQTAAFNLPNDEWVTARYGSKRVMLRNVQEAKFQKVLLPITKVALAPADRSRVAFDPFFTWILMHELMHGLGPHELKVGGRATTVRQEMKEVGSALEEAKADISGLWALQRLIESGVIAADMQRTLYPTYLASLFRSLRFGIGEAHGRGTALQMNWLLDRGAVAVASDGTFRIVEDKVRPAVEALTREIMTLQARGDYAGAKALLDREATIRPEVQKVIDRLKSVPIDIAPRYVTAEKLLATQPSKP